MITTQTQLNYQGIALTKSVSAMLAYWDENQICRFANNAYTNWFGKTREEILNKITLKELLGDSYEKNYSYITAVLNGNTQTHEREIILPNGEIRHTIANYIPDINDEKVVGFFIHISDTTPLKMYERELTLSNELFKRQNKRLLNFSNIVTHNLKSYSRNLEIILNLFLKATSEEEKKETYNYLKNISAGFSATISHLNEIVEAQNLNVLKPEIINLFEYAEMSIKLLEVQIRENGIIIHNNVDPHIQLVCNPAYMESIILNILSNAIKYRAPQRTTIIDINTLLSNNKLILQIKDNGLGINLEKYKDELFGMYKTFHGNPDANGIGLYIVKYQVEAMEGHIEVESEENVGSSFNVFLNLNKNKAD